MAVKIVLWGQKIVLVNVQVSDSRVKPAGASKTQFKKLNKASEKPFSISIRILYRYVVFPEFRAYLQIAESFQNAK